MIDALADTRRREQRRKERIRVCICIYIFYIYILDALSARNAATDPHQDNHDDTSYGKSSHTGMRHGYTGIWLVYTPYGFHTTSFSIFRRPPSRWVSHGVQQKSGLVKLGICPRYTNPRTFVKERNRFCLVKFIRGKLMDVMENERKFANP